MCIVTMFVKLSMKNIMNIFFDTDRPMGYTVFYSTEVDQNLLVPGIVLL